MERNDIVIACKKCGHAWSINRNGYAIKPENRESGHCHCGEPFKVLEKLYGTTD